MFERLRRHRENPDGRGAEHGNGGAMRERDRTVLELNRRAMRELGGEATLAIVPGATHLFEEPGALEQVARLAGDWFTGHLRPVPRRT